MKRLYKLWRHVPNKCHPGSTEEFPEKPRGWIRLILPLYYFIDCIDCKRRIGQELLSMKQQAEQELIKDSVPINKTFNRAAARLLFLCDPSDKLFDNTRCA